jgi:hypothetical protein
VAVTGGSATGGSHNQSVDTDAGGLHNVSSTIDCDSITTAEKIAIGHYVSLSRNFTFRACGILPLSTPANCQDVYADPALSIHSNSMDDLRIYPNPARDHIQVEGLTAPAAYRLLDLSGRVLASGVLRQRAAIPLPLTAPGWYLLHIAGYAPQKLLIE